MNRPGGIGYPALTTSRSRLSRPALPAPEPTAEPVPVLGRRWPRLVGLAGAVLGLAALAVGCAAYDALGEKPSGERLARIAQSPHYRDGQFVNALERRSDGASFGTFWAFAFGGSDYRTPDAGLPVVYRTAADFAGPPAPLRVTWLGHSTLLVELDGARILVDPVWGEHSAPAAIFGVRRFHAPPLPLADLPPLDAVVLSHDHYDHLDMPTIRALAETVPRFVVPLGVGSHLESWGVAPERITELDWWGEVAVGVDSAPVRLVATPARHFSGRSLGDRDQTLWAGWALVGPEHRVFYSGDTALAPEFAEVGQRLGPFDMTLIESGAYNAAWADVHLGPEQAVAVHQIGVNPVWWTIFQLSPNPRLHAQTPPGLPA